MGAINTFKTEIKEIVEDWGRYMDTTIPRGAKKQLYISLKYSNKEKLRRITEKHGINRILLQEVAIADFLLKDDEEIQEKVGEYLE